MHKLLGPIFIVIALSGNSALAAIIDTDEDGVPDSVDNCTLAANPEQTDTDNDGFGNRCDADFNNDNIVNDIDLDLFGAQMFTSNPLSDLLEDGYVNMLDYGVFGSLYGNPPGPAAP